ncbi:MAG: DUF2207 domain-containing protein [Chloroflexota bacterium]
MTKRLFLLILVVLFSLLTPAPALAGKDYHAERFDVQLDLQPGGDLTVTETVEFRFEGGPFTYVYRHLSWKNTDGITFLDASLDGLPLSQGAEAGQVEVENGDPLKVTWHFAPLSDETHIFSVRYKLAGALGTGAEDILERDVVPADHGYAIKNFSVHLNYADGVLPLEAPSLDRDFELVRTDVGVRLTATDIAEDERVTLTARFPAHSLAQSVPQWQAREQAESAAAARILPLGFLSGLATLLLGGLGLFTYIRANRRELNPPPQMVLPNPPADLPPALAGKLTGLSQNFVGTLFDLAQRGALTLREEKGNWGTTNYLLERTSAGLDLRPHEQALLALAFQPGHSQVSLAEVGNRMAYQSSAFDQALEQELIQRGWFDPQRKQKRNALIAAGFLFLLGGLILFIIGAVGAGVTLMQPSFLAPLAVILAGLGFGVFFLSIPLLIHATTYSELTPAGEEQKVRWKGFHAYLDQVSQGKEPAIRPDTFERYLAFAAVFGLGAAWAGTFQRLGGVPLPAWFQSLAGSDGDISAMLAVMTAADSAGASGSADGGGAGGDSSGAG